MQAPATVLESLLANIRSRQQFIRAQAQAGNPNLVSVQASQVSSLRGLIASQPFLEVDDATTLTEEVSSGIWSPEERISLITAISDASARRVAPMTRAARKQQSCDNLHLFFTADDWRDFDNEDWSIEKKIHTMGKRMWHFGLTCPKEDVLKRGSVILTLAALKGPTLSAESKRNMAKRLQEVIKHIDSVSRHPFTHLLSFPASPDLLPDEVQQFAYGPGGASAGPELPGYQELMRATKYRKTANVFKLSSDLQAVSHQSLVCRSSELSNRWHTPQRALMQGDVMSELRNLTLAISRRLDGD